MGTYADFKTMGRTEWKYTYTGEQLIEPARRKLEDFNNKTLIARTKLQTLLAEMTSTTDIVYKQTEQDLNINDERAEQCSVWLSEFTRTPKREFNLSLGDVTFFDLHKPKA